MVFLYRSTSASMTRVKNRTSTPLASQRSSSSIFSASVLNPTPS